MQVGYAKKGAVRARVNSKKAVLSYNSKRELVVTGRAR